MSTARTARVTHLYIMPRSTDTGKPGPFRSAFLNCYRQHGGESGGLVSLELSVMVQHASVELAVSVQGSFFTPEPLRNPFFTA